MPTGIGWWAWLLAAEPTGGGGGVDLTVLGQYGVLGVFAAILVWFAKSAHQRERDRADKAEAENRRLQDLIIERVIPAVAAASRAAEESASILAAVQRERELAALTQQQRRAAKGDL